MNGQAIASLTLQLQKSLDSNYDVTDMQTVLFVIQQLEGTTITKEQLETTRLAFYINQLRRRTVSQTLARRAKNLLKKWRDMVMPTLQQPSVASSAAVPPKTTTAAAAPPPTTAADQGLSIAVAARQSHSQPSMSSAMFANAAAINQPRLLLHSVIANSINEIQTGSANNHNRSSKSSSGLSNGGHHDYYMQQYSPLAVAQAARAAATQAAQSEAQAARDFGVSTRIISPPNKLTEVVDLATSNVLISPGGSLHISKKQQQRQPTSFANLLTSQSQPPISYSNTTTTSGGAGGPSSSKSSNFIDLMRRSESPTIKVPCITSRRQSPEISGYLRTIGSPLIQQQSNNNTQSKWKAAAAAGGGESSSFFLNGDDTGGSKNPPIVLSSAYDFHDSNSTNTMDATAMTSPKPPQSNLQSALQQAQHSRTQLIKCYSTPPSANAAETYSSSSAHRKSKKHKKDKKRNKQSNSPPDEKSQVAAVSASSILQQFVEEIPAAGEETMMTSVPGAAATVIFPPHDSLSSSSMSLFPSTSTNTMMIQNTSRMMSNNYVGGGGSGGTVDNPTESDLTFAGKFKSSSGTTTAAGGGGGTGSGVPSIASSTNNSSFDTVLSPASVTTKKSSSEKESDLIVVVESRSCSPFITAALDDSCSSSSRATIPDIVNVIHQDSNQGGGADAKTAAQVTVAPTTQQQQQMPAVPPVETVVPGPKKRGRKKGSRGIDAVIAQSHAFLNTSMFERPRPFFAGSKKVKTTKELLAEIQNRNNSSSATSSPTLPFNRQSASPSTCSEASLQSDITNRVSTQNPPRTPPEFNAILASYQRQSDVEDLNSDSNDAVGPSSSRIAPVPRKALNADGTMATDAFCDNGASGPNKSVEEYLKELQQKIPPIDYSKLDNPDEEEPVGCSCTVREIVAPVLPPKEEVIIIKSDDDDEEDFKPVALRNAVSLPAIQLKANVPGVGSAAVPQPAVEFPMMPVKRSPKKQIKSIFDLDYDDDNDPLHTFVEAAKLRSNSELPDDAASTVAVANTTTTTDSMPRKDAPRKAAVAPTMVPPQMQSTAATTTSTGDQQQFDADAIMMPPVTQYEVVEDENCPAKYRYNIQPNQITEFHINALHNSFVPNVNGNWNASMPCTSDHRKRLRRHRSSRPKNDATTEHDRDSSSCSNSSTSSSGKLYARVVPGYDHINMDKIPKDLSHVKFTKNYMKKKRKRDERAQLLLAAKTKTDKLQNSCCTTAKSSSRRSSKRKRLQSDSNSRDTNATGPEDDDAGKHKHQRRKKHKKLLNTNNSCIDSSISKIKKEEGDENQVANNAGNKNINNNTNEEDDNGGNDNKAVEVAVLNDKLGFSDDTDNACDYDEEHAKMVASLVVNPIENSGEKPYVDDVYNFLDDQAVTFIDSSSNSRDSFDQNNKTSDPYDEDDEDGGDDDEIDDDYEDEEENDDEHEVVTHDMTSSTSTTSQQHIVLTIKKKILRSNDDTENATSLTPPLAAATLIDPTESMNIITSTSPTSIRLRRVQKSAKQLPQQIKAAIATQTTTTDDRTPTTIVDNDNKILHIFDNNNIKVNLNNRLAVVSKGEGGNSVDRGSPADNLVLVDGNETPMSSNLLILPQQQQQPDDNGGDNDSKKPATDNFNSLLINLNSSNIKINDNLIENRCNDGDNSSTHNNDRAEEAAATGTAAAPSTDCKVEIKCERSNSSFFENDDDDDNSNSNDTTTTDDLPKENNQLLKTFNNLNRDNRIGLRVITNNNNNNNNNSAKINRNSSDSCEQQPSSINTITMASSTTIITTTAKIDAAAHNAPSNGCDYVEEFKEWHEVLTVRSYNDELLTILPYVVID